MAIIASCRAQTSTANAKNFVAFLFFRRLIDEQIGSDQRSILSIYLSICKERNPIDTYKKTGISFFTTLLLREKLHFELETHMYTGVIICLFLAIPDLSPPRP